MQKLSNVPRYALWLIELTRLFNGGRARYGPLSDWAHSDVNCDPLVSRHRPGFLIPQPL